MKKSRLLGAVCATVFSCIPLLSHSALIQKLDGQVVYDDDRNVTWLANSSLSIFETFGITTGINSNGTMNWNTAISWIAGMNEADYLGFSDWRLPRTLVPDSSCNDLDGSQRADSQGWDCTGSEMGHLVYQELGAARTTSVVTSSDTDELFKFSVVWPGIYWSSTAVVDDPSLVYMFDWSLALQAYINTTGDGYAWAVRDGDVVPLPPAVWLFGSGLLGLVGVARRRAT